MFRRSNADDSCSLERPNRSFAWEGLSTGYTVWAWAWTWGQKCFRRACGSLRVGDLPWVFAVRNAAMQTWCWGEEDEEERSGERRAAGIGVD